MKSALKIVAFVILVVCATPQGFADCTEGGPCQFGGCTSYDYLFNGDFAEPSCAWSASSGATLVNSGGNMCDYFLTSYGELGYNYPYQTVINQYVEIPSSEAGTQWSVGYNVEVEDPNTSWWNQMYVEVYDTTTSTLLATGTIYYGNGTDPDCRRDGVQFSADLGGHTVEVRFKASIYYTDTVFRITNVELSVL